MKKTKFDVGGMTCSACKAHVEKAVAKVTGVKEVQVNLLKNNMLVEYNEAICNEHSIVNAVQNAGYTASRLETFAPIAPAIRRPQSIRSQYAPTSVPATPAAIPRPSADVI